LFLIPTGGSRVSIDWRRQRIRRSARWFSIAIDIRIPGIQLADLRQAGLLLQGGVGYYPESNFVHLEVGCVRTWGA